MTLGVYLSFIGGKASLPDPAVLPTTGDVLRYLSYCASPTLSGTSLLHHVAQTLIDTYCCSDKQKALVKLVICWLYYFPHCVVLSCFVNKL